MKGSLKDFNYAHGRNFKLLSPSRNKSASEAHEPVLKQS